MLISTVAAGETDVPSDGYAQTNADKYGARKSIPTKFHSGIDLILVFGCRRN